MEWAWHGRALRSGYHQAGSKVLARLSSHLKALGENSTSTLILVVGQIQFLAAVGLTEVHLSLLAVSQRLRSAPKGHLQLPVIWPPHLQQQQQRIPRVPLTFQISFRKSVTP